MKKTSIDTLIKDIENICDLYNLLIYISSGISALYCLLTFNIFTLFIISVATMLALFPTYIINKVILIFKEYLDQENNYLNNINSKLDDLLQYQKEHSVFNK